MTVRVQRADVPDVLRNHLTRIQALERNPVIPLGFYEIKVFSDLQTVTTGNDKFVWMIPEDLNDYYLVHAQGFVSTVSSSGGLQVMIRNRTAAVDMLTSYISIDVSEFTSYTAAVPSVVNQTNWQVTTADLLAVDVDSAGTGAKGLGVALRFWPLPLIA